MQNGQWQEEYIWQGEEVKLRNLPPGVEVKGELVTARSWADRAGLHVLVLSIEGPKPTPGNPDARSKWLYAQEYLRKPNSRGYEQVWDIQDFEKGCPAEMDLSLQSLPPHVQLTDLDLDGYTETTLSYRMQCASDVQPYRVKIILHEQGRKYALRGYSSTPYQNKQQDPTTDFDTAPTVFWTWVQKLWHGE